MHSVKGAASARAGARAPHRQLSSRVAAPLRTDSRAPRGAPQRSTVVAVAAHQPVLAAAAVEEKTDSQGLGLNIVTTTEGCTLTVKVTVPEKLLLQVYDGVIDELRDTMQFPGFRKGAKVPTQMLVQGYGTGEFQSACCEKMLNSTLYVALEGLDGAALQDSERIVTDPEVLRSTFNGTACKPESACTYEMSVELLPSVEWTKSYDKLTATAVAAGDAATDAKAVEKELAGQRKQKSDLRIVTGRGMVKNDVLILDMDTEFLEGTDGAKDLLSVPQKGFQLDTEGSVNSLPGLIENLEGAEAGESRTFEVAFPEEWAQAALRGARANFTVKVREIFYRELPELDDDFAKQVDPECAGLEDLRTKLLKEQNEATEANNQHVRREAMLDALLECAKVPLPESLVQETGRQEYQNKLFEAQVQGSLAPDLLEQLTGAQYVANYIKSNRAKIEGLTAKTLAVGALFEKEGMEVDQEVLKREVGVAVQGFDQMGQSDEYDIDKLKAQALEQLQGEQVMDFLEGHTTFTMLPPEDDA